MSQNSEEDPTQDTFYHVRKGGPKEKRIRRVELMGEHAPLPIYFVKIAQPKQQFDYISEEVLRERLARFEISRCTIYIIFHSLIF